MAFAPSDNVTVPVYWPPLSASATPLAVTVAIDGSWPVETTTAAAGLLGYEPSAGETMLTTGALASMVNDACALPELPAASVAWTDAVCGPSAEMVMLPVNGVPSAVEVTEARLTSVAETVMVAAPLR